jgi:phosphoglycerate dehydrogenase-like enzyme
VIATDPVAVGSLFLAETGLIMTSLHELLKESDFVSLHCDLNPTSFHLIGRNELSAMKSSAYLINTARGPIIDEGALVNALREKWIAGAALDVFEVEPLPEDSALREFPNCLLATHNANNSRRAVKRVHESTIANLLNALQATR